VPFQCSGIVTIAFLKLGNDVASFHIQPSCFHNNEIAITVIFVNYFVHCEATTKENLSTVLI
jgi:hypothetical protein